MAEIGKPRLQPSPPSFTTADVRTAYERLDGAALGDMWQADNDTYWQAIDELAAEKVAAEMSEGRECAIKGMKTPYSIPEVRKALQNGAPERSDMIVEAPYLYFTVARILAKGEVLQQVARERAREARQRQEARRARIGNLFRKITGQ